MSQRLWWQDAVIYQIYPRSFQDGSGDGVGDLQGITRRLDYLAWLGVDAIWLSPIFCSPMVDFGYDVSDYLAIDPLFGTLDDFDHLLAEAHDRDLRVILDFVPNHTSDQHPWFLESRSSRDNPKRDWYIWADPRPDGSPPNNWRSVFGGSAWAWDAQTGQYYLHTFAVAQPDLNWHNPQVESAMLDVMRYWLDRGVDGFRVDVVHQLIKDSQLRDDPLNPDYDPEVANLYDALLPTYSGYQKEVHAIIKRMRKVIDHFGDRVLIGEIHYFAAPEDMRAFYGLNDEAHLPFNFWLILLDWEVAALRAFVQIYEQAVPRGATPNYVLGNHDVPRIATRIGREPLRLAAMLLLTLPGVPFIYYGEELGMEDVDLPPEYLRDVQGNEAPGRSRDPQRTPMQWDASPHAGFSQVAPWLPVAEDYAENNVAAAKAQPRSLLNFYRALLHYRRRSPALMAGRYELLLPQHATCWLYLREAAAQRVLVALNFSGEEALLDLPDLGRGRVALSTEMDRDEMLDFSPLKLRPYEGCIITL